MFFLFILFYFSVFLNSELWNDDCCVRWLALRILPRLLHASANAQNFKVRIGASAALAGVSLRRLYDVHFVDVLKVSLALSLDTSAISNAASSGGKSARDGALLYGRKLREQYDFTTFHLLTLIEADDSSAISTFLSPQTDQVAQFIDKAFNAALMQQRRQQYKRRADTSLLSSPATTNNNNNNNNNSNNNNNLLIVAASSQCNDANRLSLRLITSAVDRLLKHCSAQFSVSSLEILKEIKNSNL